MPVTIARLGLLYCRKDMAVGQRRGGDSAGIESSLNLADLSCLPLTPVMGSGRALLQPQEVEDAALRLAFLALSNPSKRPPGVCEPDWSTSRQEGGGAEEERPPVCRVDSPLLRVYDAVGPETLPMVQILQRFARYQGNSVGRRRRHDFGKDLEKMDHKPLLVTVVLRAHVFFVASNEIFTCCCCCCFWVTMLSK